MDNFLQIHCEAGCIFCKLIYTFNFWCFQNVQFLVYVEVSSYWNFVFDCCNTNSISNYFLIYISNLYDPPKAFQRWTFHWLEGYIKALRYGVFWYIKALKKLRRGWIYHNNFYRLFGNHIFCMPDIEVMRDED